MYPHPGHPYASPQPPQQPQPQPQPHLHQQPPPPPYNQHGYPQVSAPIPQMPYQPYPYQQQHPYSLPQNHPSPTSPPPELPRPTPGVPFYQQHPHQHQQQQQHQHQQQHQQHQLHRLPSPTSPYYSQHSPMSLPPIAASSTITSAGISVPTTPTTIAASHPHSPVAVSAPILYKAEMTEGQVHNWRKQQDQQNIKVEILPSTAQPKMTPPSSLSSPTPPPVPHTSILAHAQLPPRTSTQVAPQGPTQDLHELRRSSQLHGMQEHSRPNNGHGSWSQSPTPSTANMPLQSPTHGSTFPPSISQSTAMPPYPTPVELQSSLTDNSPITNKPESSLTTLDPAPTATSGMNARVPRPYGPSQPSPVPHAFPSAIEVQSSLTEMDGTTARPLSGSGSRPGLKPRPGSGHSLVGPGSGHSLVGPGSNFGGQTLQGRPASFHSHQQRPGYASAIEEQSSLTEMDTLPFPLEAQSSLTAVDDLPYSLDEQSALTELDSLPHPLHEQSSLTVVDDLPHALSEQSALTEIDGLPYGISEQSSLTVLDPKAPSTPSESTISIQSKASATIQTAPTTLPDAVSPDTSAKAAAFASPPSTATANKVPSNPSAIPFSMSNWTMPSDFSDPSLVDIPIAKKPLSPTGSLHRRAPATMHLDTPIAQDEPSTALEKADGANVLIPLTSATAGVDTPQEKSLSPSNSLSQRAKTPVGSTPPVPAPKPASLTASKANHPQSASSGARFSQSEEVRFGNAPPPDTSTVDGGVLIPLPEEVQPMGGHNPDQYNGEEDEDLEDDDDGDDDGDLDKADDGVSAFIRELQSSMSLSRSGSSSNSMVMPNKHKGVDDVKRSDSNSSKSSQKVSEKSYGDAKANGASRDPPQATGSSTIPQPTPSSANPQEGVQAAELQQLAATQFEWTFTETEQAAYERIFSLWERPAEGCVSSDIAGKVFMTLGLTNHDLYKIWQLLNHEEKPVLTRTQFIAGLHLVNCKVVGYELPDDLPDELMMSAAAVGRIVIPPRPVQGPSTILPGQVEAAVREEPPVPSFQGQPLMKNNSLEADPMSTYSIPLPGYSAVIPPAALAYPDPHPNNSDIYLAYPHQPYQPQQVPNTPRDQFLPQYQFTEKNAHQGHGVSSIPYPTPAPAPAPASAPAPTPTMALSKPIPPPDMPVRPSKPGPHALHDLPADAPVMVSGIIDLPMMNEREIPFSAEFTDRGTAIHGQSMPGHSGTVILDRPPSPVAAVSSEPSVDSPDVYASPPDAWDHDAAPPELDVDGSYIKYRSGMTLSASVTANHPINPNLGVFYFEVTIDQFKGGKGSALSIGIASKSLRKNCQVGWDLNSWGYHSDNGYLYFGNGNQSIQYSYEFNEEDVVGCGINFKDRVVFFTLNGHMQGVAFRFIKDTILLYPAVGLSHSGTVINANFGDQTFLFNIVDYKKSVMSRPPQTQPVITWNPGVRNDKMFKVLSDSLSVVATGNDVGCIRGPKVSPRDRDVFYFEITILYMPPTDSGTIIIGICGKDQPMKEAMGWKANSYGYSGECGDFLSISSNRSSLNARSQSGKMKARARGPMFRAGSVVGCGVDFASRELFFTLNGECLGQAFYEVDVLDCHPCVCIVSGSEDDGTGGPLSGPRPVYPPISSTGSGGSGDERIGCEFKANFGQSPFMFDLPAFEASGGQ